MTCYYLILVLDGFGIDERNLKDQKEQRNEEHKTWMRKRFHVSTRKRRKFPAETTTTRLKPSAINFRGDV